MSEIWDCYDKNFNLVEGKVLVRGQETSFSEDEQADYVVADLNESVDIFIDSI